MLREDASPINRLPRRDAIHFLSSPYTGFEASEGSPVAPIEGNPDLALLLYLPTLPHATALYQDEGWHVVRGSIDGVPKRFISPDADTFTVALPGEIDGTLTALPNISTLYNASYAARNFAVSHQGITHFRAPSSAAFREVEAEVFHTHARFSSDDPNGYKDFLAAIGVKYKLYPWRNLDDERLGLLLGNLD